VEIILEVRAGEGGDDAKLFVVDMLRMYRRYCIRKKIVVEPVSFTESTAVLKLNGDTGDLLRFEGGVHRLQRVPPTERQGRRHSSTLTVVVLPVENDGFELDENEVRYETFRGTGPGGQHRNKTESGVRAVHVPTRMSVSCCNERSQHQNKHLAFLFLRAKLAQTALEKREQDTRAERQRQVGTAGRSEKIRTYNLIENRVKDERLDRPLYSLDRVLNGELDLLHDRIKHELV
jgi:peptide chain release factor 1